MRLKHIFILSDYTLLTLPLEVISIWGHSSDSWLLSWPTSENTCLIARTPFESVIKISPNLLYYIGALTILLVNILSMRI